MSRKYLTGIDLSKNELLNAAIQNLATAPSSPSIGQIYFDTVLNNLRQWDGAQWLDYLTAESGAGYITSVGSNLDVTDQQLTLGANVVITDGTQVLTNKTYSTPTLKGTVSFTNSSDTEILAISQTGVGTVRINATDDLSLRSTNGDIILYPGNELGGVGKVYIGYGNANPATGAGVAGADNEVATLGDTQTFSNKTFLDGFEIGDGTNSTSSVYVDTNDLYLYAPNTLHLNTGNGDIVLNADGNIYKNSVNSVNEIITQNRLDNYIGDETVTGATGHTITDRIATAKSEAQTYADGLVQGLNVKDSVIRMSNASIDLLTWNADGSFLDGVDTIQAGSRVLLTAQSTAAENGIYLIQGDGSLARAEDQPTVDKGDYTLVVEGTYAATGWIATSATVWTQFSAANEYTAGNGIGITGNAISVDLDGDTLAVSGTGLKANLAEGGGLDTDGGIYIVTGAGLTVDNTNALTLDTANGYGVRKYAATNTLLEPTSNVVSWPVTHGLGTRDVTVQVYTLDTYEQIEVDVARSNTTAVTLSWVATANVAADSYRVVVVG